MKTFKYLVQNRHATWLELFFDLVFVSSIGIVTHQLAHTHNNHIDSKQIWMFPLQFLSIWWIWILHTLFANRFDTDSRYHRISSLAIMFLMITMTAFLGNDLFENYSLFIGFYSVIQIIIAILYISSIKVLNNSKEYAFKCGLIIIIGTIITGVSFFLPDPYREISLVLGILFEMIAFVLVSKKKNVSPVHKEHLVERIGLLSIILLGESFISLTSALRDVNWDMLSVIAASTGFIMIGLIWWIYYDSFHIMERLKAMKNGFILIYSHFFLAMGFVILANVIRHAILNDLNQNDFRVLAILGMCFFYVGKQTIYFKFLPPFRKPIVINTLICVLITVGSTFLPKIEYALIGVTIGMLYYTIGNFKFTLTKDVSRFLD
jgi:low temperature requirement protein LtrA